MASLRRRIMLDKLKGIFEAQKQMNVLKRELEKMTVEFESRDGKVKVSMSGTQKVTGLEISEDLLAPGKKNILEKTVMDSVNEAAEKVQRAASEKLRANMGDLKLPGM